MELPLMIAGEERGSLRLTREGLYTVLEAELPGVTDRLVRLWAHGGGESAYLGVMQPRSGGLWLCRRLSRRELARFPEPVEFASDREREESEGAERADTQSAEEDRESGEDLPENESLHSMESDRTTALNENEGGVPDAETDLRSCPWPAEPPEEGLDWYGRPDGTLVAFDGVSSLVAIPARLRAPTGRAAEREIGGKKYLVFRY